MIFKKNTNKFVMNQDNSQKQKRIIEAVPATLVLSKNYRKDNANVPFIKF